MNSRIQKDDPDFDSDISSDGNQSLTAVWNAKDDSSYLCNNAIKSVMKLTLEALENHGIESEDVFKYVMEKRNLPGKLPLVRCKSSGTSSQEGSSDGWSDVDSLDNQSNTSSR